MDTIDSPGRVQPVASLQEYFCSALNGALAHQQVASVVALHEVRGVALGGLGRHRRHVGSHDLRQLDLRAGDAARRQP